MVNDKNNPEPKNAESSDDDFDIDSLLRKLHDDHYKKIEPDDPAYYLRLIRKNRPIREALGVLAQPKMQPIIKAFYKEIESGNWNAVSHNYMKETYPNNPELHDIRVKDMLFYAFAAANHIRPGDRKLLAEFGTAHMVLNVREQFGLEIRPEYEDSSIAKGFKTQVPARLEKFEMHKLFNEDGKLTDPGIAYLNNMVANIEKLHEEFKERGIPVEFDRAAWFNNLEKAFKEIPPNLQIFFDIPNSKPIEELKDIRHDPDAYWQSRICAKEMPLFAAPDPELGKKAGMDINKHIYSPSVAIIFAFLEQLREQIQPGEFVHPVFCLGLAGGRESASLHKRRFHTVAIMDDRTKSNQIDGHRHIYDVGGRYEMGALYNFMHEISHSMYVTLHSQRQIDLCCETFPKAIDKSVATNKDNTKDKFEEYLAKRMIEELTDFPSLVPQAMNPEHFLQIGFRGAAIPLQNDLFPKEDFFDSFDADQKKNKTIAFLKKCLNEIKNTHPKGLSWQSLGQNQSWQLVENYLDEIRNYQGKASVPPEVGPAESLPTILGEGFEPADKKSKSRRTQVKEKAERAMQKAREVVKAGASTLKIKGRR